MESARSPSVSSFSCVPLAVPGGWVQGWESPPSESPEAGAGVGSGRERKERRDSIPESYWLSSASSGPFRASDMPAAPARGARSEQDPAPDSAAPPFRVAGSPCGAGARSGIASFPGCRGPMGRREAQARLREPARYTVQDTPGSWAARSDSLFRPAPQAPPRQSLPDIGPAQRNPPYPALCVDSESGVTRS